MTEQHWSKQKERGSYLGIRFLFLFYRLGGRFLVKIGLIPVLFYFFITSRRTRRASQDYLRRVFEYFGPTSALPTKPRLTTSFMHFWQFANSALDKVDAWVGQIQLQDLAFGSIEHFESNLKHGKGAVLIASHIGNVEVCRALVKQRFSTRMNVLVFTQHAARFNRILKEVNPSVDLDLIQANNVTPDLVLMLKSRVENGECVVIVGDRISVDSPGNVMWVDFLGKPAPFAIGPWILASVLECPVYYISCLLENTRYRLEVQFLAEQIELPRRHRQDLLQTIVQSYAAFLEATVRNHPLQWYNFYNFWCLPEKE